MLKLFNFLWLIENVFTLYGGGKGGGDAPDYNPGMIAQAQASERSAAADLAFRKQQYDEAKPRLMDLYDKAGKVSQAQYETMKASDQRAADQNKFWEDNYRPTELRSLQEANDAGSASDQERLAGKAVTDVRQQTAITQQATSRNLAAMGVNPNSAKFAGLSTGVGLQGAASAAGAATNARETAKNQGIALRAGAVATGRGMQNVAGQTAATSLNQGNSAVGNANTGAQGGLGYAGMVGQGYQNQTQAHTSMFNGYANLQGQSNQINAQQNSGGSGILGLAGTLGGAYLSTLSDKRLKENIEFIGEENGIPMYAFEYSDGFGLPKGRFIGTMAQDILEINPDAVTTDADGYMSVNYSKLGIEMRAA